MCLCYLSVDVAPYPCGCSDKALNRLHMDVESAFTCLHILTIIMMACWSSGLLHNLGGPNEIEAW
jgi:hypothetical protein